MRLLSLLRKGGQSSPRMYEMTMTGNTTRSIPYRSLEERAEVAGRLASWMVQCEFHARGYSAALSSQGHTVQIHYEPPVSPELTHAAMRWAEGQAPLAESPNPTEYGYPLL